jgi:hypothetical protein
MYTYLATNTANGKFYIGSTKDFDHRKKQHLKSCAEYPFQRALRKNPEAFTWEVYQDDYDEPVLEQALLEMWYGTEQCYNLSSVVGRPGPEVCVRAGKASCAVKHSVKNSEGKSVAAVAAGKKAGAKAAMPMKKGGAAMKMASGGSASSRADGIAQKGKTKGKMMAKGGRAC